MGIFDKAREAPHEHADQVDRVVDRLADPADRRTRGSHRATVDHGADLAEQHAHRDTAVEPGQPG